MLSGSQSQSFSFLLSFVFFYAMSLSPYVIYPSNQCINRSLKAFYWIFLELSILPLSRFMFTSLYGFNLQQNNWLMMIRLEPLQQLIEVFSATFQSVSTLFLKFPFAFVQVRFISFLLKHIFQVSSQYIDVYSWTFCLSYKIPFFRFHHTTFLFLSFFGEETLLKMSPTRIRLQENRHQKLQIHHHCFHQTIFYRFCHFTKQSEHLQAPSLPLINNTPHTNPHLILLPLVENYSLRSLIQLQSHTPFRSVCFYCNGLIFLQQSIYLEIVLRVFFRIQDGLKS